MPPFRKAFRPLLALAFAFTCSLAKAAGPSSHPDIVLILTDDLAFNAIGAGGNAVVRTPNIDRLAASGTLFTHAYNSGAWNGAVCIASRTMLMTGLQFQHAKAADLKGLVKDGRMWSQLLAKAGYHTFMTGKWHVVGADPKACFEQTEDLSGGFLPSSGGDAAYRRPSADGSADAWRSDDKAQGGFWRPDGRHWSEVTADRGIEMIKAGAAKAEPYFLYLAFNAPHDPRQAPREYLDQYPEDQVDVPASFQPEYPYAAKIGCDASLRDENLAPFPRTPHAVRVHRREYYAAISYLDAQVGRVLEAIAKHGRPERTLILFTSDHGLACGDHGFLGKQNMYESALRPPLILAGPGFKAGATVEERVYMQDIMPTALEAAGVPVPATVDFKSLSPLTRDPGAKAYDEVHAVYMHLQRMVIAEGWKLIEYPEAKVVRLYDLGRDPQELHDLAGDPAQASRVAALREKLPVLSERTNGPKRHE